MAQNPEADFGAPRSKQHTNGSVLCDKWYRYGKCSRLACEFSHRDGVPNQDIIPPCNDYFTLKDGCPRKTRCGLSHSREATLVRAKGAPKASARSRGSEINNNSHPAPERPVFVLPEMPKAREGDKASSIAKSKTVPNPPGRSNGGEGSGVASRAPTGTAFVQAKYSRGESSRGSHWPQQRSAPIRGDDKAGVINARRPPPRFSVAHSDHVQNIAHSKGRDDRRNRRSLPNPYNTRTAPRETKVELSQLDDEAGDNQNDGGVSLETLGPKTSIADTLPPSFPATIQKTDVAGNTSNITRIDNKARSITVESTKIICQAKPASRSNSKYENSSGDGNNFGNPRVVSPPTAPHERVMTSDSSPLVEESQTICGDIEPKPPVSDSFSKFLKASRGESSGCNIEEDELFQISSGGVRLLDKFARHHAPDPEAIQKKYGHRCFLLQADPPQDISQLRYTVEDHKSMFWQLDPIRFCGIDPRKIKPETNPRNDIARDFAQRHHRGVSLPNLKTLGWESRDASQNPHHRCNHVPRTMVEYDLSTGRAPPRPAGIAHKEHGGDYPSKNQLNCDDLTYTVSGDRRSAYSGNSYNGQSQGTSMDVDRASHGKMSNVFSDHSSVATADSTSALTGTDRTVAVESLGMSTSEHEGHLSENSVNFSPNERVPEHANNGFSKTIEEKEILPEPVVKEEIADEAYTPCDTPDVIEGVMIPTSPQESTPSVGSDQSSLTSSAPSSPAPLLEVEQQSTGSNDEGSLTSRRTRGFIQAEVPQNSEKPLGPPDNLQMSCLTPRDEAKMALAANLQKPGQFAAKEESALQQNDPEIHEVSTRQPAVEEVSALPQNDTEIEEEEEDPMWMNDSDSGIETPSVWEWDWDKKSSQTGLTDDEWNAGVPLDQTSVESFDGVAENKTESPVSPVERVFELPECPGSLPNPQKQEANKRRPARKYKAKESKESPMASERKNDDSLVLANNTGMPRVPENNVVKQPVSDTKARKPPLSNRKAGEPPLPVNKMCEPFVSEGVNGRPVASVSRTRNSPRFRNKGDAYHHGGIRKLPREVLHAIFSYAADGVLPEVQVKAKDLTYGCNFEVPSTFNKIRYKGLWSMLRTCHYWRDLGREILYKYVNLSEWSTLELFARTVSRDHEIGALVRSLRISVPQFTPQSSYQSYNNRDRNSRIVATEQVDGFQLLPDIVQRCPLIHVMSIDMPNAVPAFNKLVSMQKLPNLREIQIKDGGERIATGERVWENMIRNAPDLKKLVITQDQDLSLRNAPTMIKIPDNIFHGEQASTFRLTQIHLTRSYEITDGILLLLSGKLSNLKDLDIVDCPLVTSRGIAKMLDKMPNRLKRLSYWIWINHYGNVSKREQNIGVDLCHVLGKCGQGLQHMDIKIFLACHHLWKDGFRELQRCRIMAYHYHDCVKKVNNRSSASFENSLSQARLEGKLPALAECQVVG
ncbi:hypothetical protein L873DRAFT_1094292 [Choiromyces venosus 120613-1]|uniref:RNI-like protein n=1 Tax=Choiromyces venosus 120613-1 TaxID=1336337 RepID=A0A3N4JHW7_9PEZI|nr:hypothetical protein L873DRAFT_1094292 [Choiromyces venosus 120613-1]